MSSNESGRKASYQSTREGDSIMRKEQREKVEEHVYELGVFIKAVIVSISRLAREAHN